MRDISLALLGSGGTGVVTLGQLLMTLAARGGLYGLMSKSYGPQIRGGESAALLRLSSAPVTCAADSYDLLVALDWRRAERFADEIPLSSDSNVLYDPAGGEPPTTYRSTIDLALNDDRIHALVLGYWHTIITPPMVFAELLGEAVAEARANGIDKPVVASLVGDVEIEEACEYLMDRDILAYPYTAEKPVAVLGAKYRWARAAGLL